MSATEEFACSPHSWREAKENIILCIPPLLSCVWRPVLSRIYVCFGLVCFLRENVLSEKEKHLASLTGEKLAADMERREDIKSSNLG